MGAERGGGLRPPVGGLDQLEGRAVVVVQELGNAQTTRSVWCHVLAANQIRNPIHAYDPTPYRLEIPKD